MRVNVYAEEMTNRIEIISKEIDGQTYTGLRFYLELPVTIPGYLSIEDGCQGIQEVKQPARNVSGPFFHRPGDDDSAAVTFWGKKDLKTMLRKALTLLEDHYANQK